MALWFDDLHVGLSFTSATHTLTAEEIVAFARQYDPQPFHLDHEAARDTLFGGLAASGWHTAAISMKLLVGDGAPFEGGIIGSGGELAWPRPTYPGDTLRVVWEVTELTPSRTRPDRGMVKVRMETRNQRNEIVQVFSPRLVVPCRPKA